MVLMIAETKLGCQNTEMEMLFIQMGILMSFIFVIYYNDYFYWLETNLKKHCINVLSLLS